MDGYRYTRTYTHTQTSIYIQSTMDLNVKGHGWWFRPVTLPLFNEVNQGTVFLLLEKILFKKHQIFCWAQSTLGRVFFPRKLGLRVPVFSDSQLLCCDSNCCDHLSTRTDLLFPLKHTHPSSAQESRVVIDYLLTPPSIPVSDWRVKTMFQSFCFPSRDPMRACRIDLKQ